MILAGVATHFNSRASVARQTPEAAANPQTALMNKLALYVFPLGVIVGGPFLPLAVIIYWVANNIWTYGQQHFVFGRIEKEEEAKKAEALERRSANAPAPGKKPKRARPAVNGAEADPGDESVAEEVPTVETNGDGSTGAATPKAGGGAAAKPPGARPSTSRTPQPGARPKKRKR
jgi:YidC/Oxa1 family membrane protein insertase